MDRARQILKDVFGFPSFRLSQGEAIARLIEQNENALVVYPTGGSCLNLNHTASIELTTQ
jgi:superfamily II DNA helicase RecQ